MQTSNRTKAGHKHYQSNTDMSRSVSPGEPWPWAQSGGQSRWGRLPPSLREPRAPVDWSPLEQSWLQNHKHWVWIYWNISERWGVIHDPGSTKWKIDQLEEIVCGWLVFCSIDQRFSTFLTPKGQTVQGNIQRVPKNKTSASAVKIKLIFLCKCYLFKCIYFNFQLIYFMNVWIFVLQSSHFFWAMNLYDFF